MDRTGVITFKGNPMTLVGPALKAGDAAPDFTAYDQGLKPVRLSDFRGKTVVLSFVPSLDTPVCELQTKRFNQEASKTDSKIVTISLDLPFAQKRFCEAHKIADLQIVSDYRGQEFARNWGMLIKELGLITRGVAIVDAQGKIAYLETVKEVTQEPNYDAALNHLRNMAPAGAR